MKSKSQAPCALLPAALVLLLCVSPIAKAQSTKGGGPTQQQRPYSQPPSALAQSPGTQIRQQQYTTPASIGRPTPTTLDTTKRRQPVEQQSYNNRASESASSTDDPLADSEPALYGSVAGAPGVDFPAYTRIPKTSFTCEGKGFDFGFYADEEAGCQVYHVCWSGRRESFLCGVGTVFNQAILACDYWHSVDCSKSSQFYGVNSELGKASGEPAPAGLQRARPVAANLPQSGRSSGGQQASAGYGEPVAQRRQQQSPAQILQQQQLSSFANDEFDQQQQPLASVNRQSPGSYSSSNFGAPQRVGTNVQFQPTSTNNYNQQAHEQQRLEVVPNTKGARQQPATTTPASTTSTTIATTTIQPIGKTRNRPTSAAFNMDLSQKVNSLIESPVRPPLASGKASSASPPPPVAKTQQQRISPSTRRPAQQPSSSFARLAVARAQQQGSQTLNSGRKGARPSAAAATYNTQQQYDSELDEHQQQQSNFDDLPVRTTLASGGFGRPQQLGNGAAPAPAQQQQLVIQAGGGSDGSSAITTQYDTLQPTGNGGAQQQQVQQQQQQQQRDLSLDDNQAQQQSGSSQDAGYESALNDASDPANDDFRSAGARAAASHNQNWYIMRSI